LALDTALGLSLELLKQSTPASIQCPGISVENRTLGPTLVKKVIMKNIGIKNGRAGAAYNKILVNHWRWLQAQGPSYKQQATSCKLQASGLTRKLYTDIGYSRIKKYENK